MKCFVGIGQSSTATTKTTTEPKTQTTTVGKTTRGTTKLITRPTTRPTTASTISVSTTKDANGSIANSKYQCFDLKASNIKTLRLR